MKRVKIIGTGSFLPEDKITNFDIEKLVETSDDWIRTRTGIIERRRAKPEQAASDIAAPASMRALEMAGLDVQEIDMLLVATITPDTSCPAAACWLQSKIGAKNAVAFDIGAACSGFIFGLSVAEQYLRQGSYKKVLLCAVEIMTRTVNWRDRESCILWGDGAGAVVLELAEGDNGILSTHIHTDGTLGDKLLLPGGGSKTTPISHESVDKNLHWLKMDGPDSFKIAVRAFSSVCKEALDHNGFKSEDIALCIPHQANLRIIEAVAKRVNIDMNKVYITIHKYGNISSATIPIALDEALRERRIQEGDLVLLAAFGGGLAWGSTLMRW